MAFEVLPVPATLAAWQLVKRRRDRARDGRKSKSKKVIETVCEGDTRNLAALSRRVKQALRGVGIPSSTSEIRRRYFGGDVIDATILVPKSPGCAGGHAYVSLDGQVKAFKNGPEPGHRRTFSSSVDDPRLGEKFWNYFVARNADQYTNLADEIKSLGEAEIPYDEWIKNAAVGKYDAWLRRDPGAWSGNVTIGVYGNTNKVPAIGYYVVNKSLKDSLTEIANNAPAFNTTRADPEGCFNNEIVLNNITVIVAEANTNKVFKVFSVQPWSTLGKEQLKAVVQEFDIHAYDELQWANGVNRPTRAVNTFQYFTGRPTKIKEPKRL
jgi:hypothetical protein